MRTDLVVNRLRREFSAYLSEFWNWLAAIAWLEHRVHGPGVLIVEPAAPVEEHGSYVPFDAMDSLASMPELAHLIDLVRPYDPREEVAVMFLKAPNVVEVWKGRPPRRRRPPRAEQWVAEWRKHESR